MLETEGDGLGDWHPALQSVYVVDAAIGIAVHDWFPLIYLPHDPFHRVENVLIAGTSAQMPGYQLLKIVPVVFFSGSHNLHRAHNKAGSTEAALYGCLLDKCLLNG